MSRPTLVEENFPVMKKMIAIALMAATVATSLATGSVSAGHTKDSCKNGGFEMQKVEYKNQGQCIKPTVGN